jgi:ribosome maturation factor RimP
LRLYEESSMADTHKKEKELQRAVTNRVESDVPGVEVLAVELAGVDRFTVYVDHPQGVDHALCERVTNVLRDYLRDYSVEVSSPGFERPLRKPAHFRNAVGRRVKLRTSDRARLKGRVAAAEQDHLALEAEGGERQTIPYDAIVRANLIDERETR